MTDLSRTIAPKSDQLNADDMITGPMTITITRVSAGDGDQPVSINYEGDNGKPYKPCKSMRRVLVNAWGKDGASYVGRQLTLYRDDRVQFGGQAVGGIRISHMSHIDGDKTMALTTTRAQRKPYTVKPMPAQQARGGQSTTAPAKPAQSLAERVSAVKAAIEAADTPDRLASIWTRAEAVREHANREDPDGAGADLDYAHQQASERLEGGARA